MKSVLGHIGVQLHTSVWQSLHTCSVQYSMWPYIYSMSFTVLSCLFGRHVYEFIYMDFNRWSSRDFTDILGVKIENVKLGREITLRLLYMSPQNHTDNGIQSDLGYPDTWLIPGWPPYSCEKITPLSSFAGSAQTPGTILSSACMHTMDSKPLFLEVGRKP